MVAFIVRRLILAVVVLIALTFITFILIHVIPGDPVLAMLGKEATPEQIATIRQELWLDHSLPEQYGHWMFQMLHGDFGRSIMYNINVTELISKRLPVTLYIFGYSLVFSVFFGILAGTLCAVRRGGVLDQIITFLANVGVGVPTFWLGILGIYLFGVKLGWLPIQGYTSPFDNFVLSTKQIIMPVICLSAPFLGFIARQTRSSMLEAIHQDYIRTAWAKGLNERVIVSRHALKNALIPVVTLIGLQIRLVAGGTVLTETVFNIPGMGRLMIQAILDKDFIIVQACIIVSALVVASANLIADISYRWLDPRIRLGVEVF